MDNDLRLKILEQLKQLFKDYQKEVEMCGYHDPTEFKVKAID